MRPCALPYMLPCARPMRPTLSTSMRAGGTRPSAQPAATAAAARSSCLPRPHVHTTPLWSCGGRARRLALGQAVGAWVPRCPARQPAEARVKTQPGGGAALPPASWHDICGADAAAGQPALTSKKKMWLENPACVVAGSSTWSASGYLAAGGSACARGSARVGRRCRGAGGHSATAGMGLRVSHVSRAATGSLAARRSPREVCVGVVLLQLLLQERPHERVCRGNGFETHGRPAAQGHALARPPLAAPHA